MKPDRPLIASILFLASGLGLICNYCQGTAGLNAAFPISLSTLHLCVTLTGAAVVGGVVFTALGLALMIWAVFVALIGQVMLLSGSDTEPERLLE